MNKNLFLLLGIVLVTTSCKKHLTKKYAKAQIMAEFKYPKVANYEIPKAFTKDRNTDGVEVDIIIDDDDGEWEEKLKMINAFEKNKLIIFEETPRRTESSNFLGNTVRTWTEVKISLTDEGKKSLISEEAESFEVKLWETSLDAITDIQEKGKGEIALVKYTISNKGTTPFGESFPDGNKTTQITTYFTFQDNVWKMMQGGYPIY